MVIHEFRRNPIGCFTLIVKQLVILIDKLRRCDIFIIILDKYVVSRRCYLLVIREITLNISNWKTSVILIKKQWATVIEKLHRSDTPIILCDKHITSIRFCLLLIEQIVIILRKHKTLIMQFTLQCVGLIEKLRRSDIFIDDNRIIYLNPIGVI